ncbi:MAG: 4Fe-4S binding protein [Clostridiales bacterium]|nr:4Fe-4S binding protein [Clostridiales bacterium]
MNVLILGRNEMNVKLAEAFKKRGYSPIVIEDADEVKAFRGEPGDFIAKTGSGEVEASFVVVTEPARGEPPNIEGGMPIPLFDDVAFEEIAAASKEPIVYLLDYFCESPQAATARALEAALALAGKKKSVAFIFKFMRTAAGECEELYRKARCAGVTFIKYEKINIACNSGTGVYTIKAQDGENEVILETRRLIADGGRGASCKFTRLAEKLRLKTAEGGYENEGRYFLAPAFTGRNGVYYLNQDLYAGRLKEGLDFFVSAVCGDIGETRPENNHAAIDGEKCVFCYSCYRICPHGAMEPGGESRVMKNLENACKGCGLCAVACPGNAITMKEDDFVETEALEKQGKVKLLCCENSGSVALKEILPGLGEQAFIIDFQTVACGGRAGFEQLAESLRSYGKVIALVCMDDACRHFDGNKAACKQAARLSFALERAGAGTGKAFCIKTSFAMANTTKEDILEVLNDCC